MTRFPIKRRLPGLRLLAFALVSLLGGALALLLPVLCVALLFWVLQVTGLMNTPAAALALPVGLGSFVLMANELGKLSERALRLRAKWGDMVVGLDGVSWDDWIRRKFLPWKDIAKTREASDAVWLSLASGREVPLLVDLPRTVKQAIDEARGRATATARAEVPAALEPSTDVTRWIEGARALARGSYRGGVPDDVLLRVVEDPNSAPLVRVGAAMALAETKHAAPRVRVVIDELADEELRLAMEEAADTQLTPKRVAALAKRR